MNRIWRKEMCSSALQYRITLWYNTAWRVLMVRSCGWLDVTSRCSEPQILSKGPRKQTAPQPASISTSPATPLLSSPATFSTTWIITHIVSGIECNANPEDPYQYHVSGGDVHVGGNWFLAPRGGAAAGRRAGCGPVAELGRHAVEPRVAQRLRTFDALRRPDRHPLATQLLRIAGDDDEPLDHQKRPCLFFPPYTRFLSWFYIFMPFFIIITIVVHMFVLIHVLRGWVL